MTYDRSPTDYSLFLEHSVQETTMSGQPIMEQAVPEIVYHLENTR